jgi:outer membrane protein
MKKIIIAIAFLALANTTFAQQKIGYLSSLELLSLMPEIKTADKSVETYAKTFQDQLMTMQKDYEAKVKAFQASEKTMNDAIKEVKYKEIQDLQNNMMKLQESGEEKIQAKKEELYKPALEKANTAIQAVGKENNYTYIIDTSSSVLLYAKESENVLPLVKTKLGLK